MKFRCLLTFLLVSFCSALIFAQDSQLQVLSKPKPRYTDLARQKCIIGVVVLSATFREDGTMGEIKVIKALPFGLTETAIDAARKMEFIPANVSGVRQTILKRIEYRFDIYTDDDDKDIQKRAKILNRPVFDFSEEEKAEIRRLDLKINLSLGGDGVVSLDDTEPKIGEPLRSRIEEAVAKISTRPAILKGGCRISTTRKLSLNGLK